MKDEFSWRAELTEPLLGSCFGYREFWGGAESWDDREVVGRDHGRDHHGWSTCEHSGEQEGLGMSDSHRTARRWTWFDWGLGAIALVAVGLLAMTFLRSERPRTATALLAQRVEGRVLTVLPPSTRKGQAQPLPAFSSARGTLLLTFHPTCPACEANYPNWVTLARDAALLRDVQVLAVTVEDSTAAAAGWLLDRGIQVDALLAPAVPAAVRTQWGVEAVPATYVVDGGGRVVRARFGILDSEDQRRTLEALQSIDVGSRNHSRR